MKIHDLLYRLKKSVRPSLTTVQVKKILRTFTTTLQSLPPNEKTFIKDFGTFQRKTRAPRTIVGFDGETEYRQPSVTVLTFRETRKRAANGPK